MSPAELAAVKKWVAERWGETAWDKTKPEAWQRVPAPLVWGVLIAGADQKTPPTPGDVRAATKDGQVPSSNGWKEWAEHLGLPSHFGDAVRQQHLAVMPDWSPECRCEMTDDRRHTACHQPACDLHGPAIAAWLDSQKAATAPRMAQDG